jgi:hypothetical protein
VRYHVCQSTCRYVEEIAGVVCPVSALKGGWLKIRIGVSQFLFGVWVIGYVEGN